MENDYWRQKALRSLLLYTEAGRLQATVYAARADIFANAISQLDKKLTDKEPELPVEEGAE